MQAFSATEALSPAINRTKSLLFEPFQWGTFLKLCFVAVFSEGFSKGFNFSHPSLPDHTHDHTAPAFPTIPALPHIHPAWIVALAAIAVVLIVLALVIFYLSVRLRFALFECLIRQNRFIAPGWYKYRFQAFRFFLLSIVAGIVFFAAVVAVLLPFGLGIWHVFQQSQTGGPFPVAGFLAVFLPLIPLILLIALTAICLRIILGDFMLPHMALENASAGQAWAAARTRIKGEWGRFLLFGLLRVVVPMAAVIGLAIILFIPCIIVFGALAIAMAAVYAALISHAAIPLPVIGWFLEGFLGLIMFGLGFLLAISLGGPIAIGMRNYALLFYGGRYQALGDILIPPPAAAPMMQPGIA